MKNKFSSSLKYQVCKIVNKGNPHIVRGRSYSRLIPGSESEALTLNIKITDIPVLSSL